MPDPTSNALSPNGRLTDHPVGRRNIVAGWMTMWLGILSGSILMAWSFAGPFPAPPGFHDYADLSRRMTRLAHVALVMLPLINIMVGRELDRMPLGERAKQWASWGALFGMVGVPLGLFLGALVHIDLKWVSVLPVNGMLLSLFLMAVGAYRANKQR